MYTEVGIAGVDEVGRGALAGPVVAAAVILPQENNTVLSGLRDSKLLSQAQREKFYAHLMALAVCSVGSASLEEIEELNILQASLLAMQRAIMGLAIAPTAVWVDGKFAPAVPYRTHTLIRGDSIMPAISAASIVAKVSRDRLAVEWESVFPGYGFSAHKGYPTAAHLRALREWGPTKIHRMGFRPLRQDTPAALMSLEDL